MTQWRVEALNKRVEDELADLPDDMQAHYARIVERIMQAGLEKLYEPHVRHVDRKLWEMRLKGRDGIARALYVAIIGRRVIVLRVFVKKTEKTPRSEIDLAYARMKEIKI